jgi:hypothetical protein
MAHPNIEQRRAAVVLLAQSGVEFTPSVYRALSVLYACTPSAIRNDLRAAESSRRIEQSIADPKRS